jgi:hypothetical protein
MAGNGYFEGAYYPSSTETWASLTGGWDTYTSGWDLTPNLPLTFTTDVVDFGRSEYLNYLATAGSNYPVSWTVQYSDSVDSSGALVSATTINVSPSQTLSGAKGRYWQFTVSVDRDSAGQETPYISGIDTQLKTEKRVENVTDIDSSTLGGSVGQRQLALDVNLSKITSAVIQPLIPITITAPSTSVYVNGTGDYVASGYVEELYFGGSTSLGTLTGRPQVYVDKVSNPPVLYIYDFDTYGKTKQIDCTFDAIITGLPPLASNSDGNIEEV